MHVLRGGCAIIIPLIGVIRATAGLAQTPGGSLAVVSDYVNHGISQTCGRPAVQGDVHLRSNAGEAAAEGFLGVWGSISSGSADCEEPREIDAYAGLHLTPSANTGVTLSYVHYAYPGGGPAYLPASGERYDYDELSVVWAYQDQLYATVAWTPDALRYSHHRAERDRSAFSYGLQLHRPIWGSISLLAGAGYDQIADVYGTGYGFWSAGAGYAWRAFDFEVQYFQTSSRADRLFDQYTAGGRVAAAAVWRF